GLTKKTPRFLCAQAENNSPVVQAFKNGWDKIRRAPEIGTIAHAIDNPFPPSGNRVLSELRCFDGAAVAVPEGDIVKAQADLARCGLFAQPASCVPLGALRQARGEGIVSEGQSAALILTGSGLKYTAAFAAHKLHWQDCGLEDLQKLLR
ncbi:MAG: pyridoxal-phosphate dependent enzyme, partial [Pyramidobacter sp.]